MAQIKDKNQKSLVKRFNNKVKVLEQETLLQMNEIIIEELTRRVS